MTIYFQTKLVAMCILYYRACFAFHVRFIRKVAIWNEKYWRLVADYWNSDCGFCIEILWRGSHIADCGCISAIFLEAITSLVPTPVRWSVTEALQIFTLLLSLDPHGAFVDHGTLHFTFYITFYIFSLSSTVEGGGGGGGSSPDQIGSAPHWLFLMEGSRVLKIPMNSSFKTMTADN